MKARTATYILLLTIASALPSGLQAQQPQTAAQQPAYPAAQQGKTDTKGMTVLMPGETPKPTKYVEVKEQEQHLVFFQGFNISADVYGPAAYALSDYGWAEGALRLNLKNTFFPIVEIGYAKCEKADVNTSITYNVSAPYGRIGVDINMLKNKFQDNRLYLGARYGISKFKYDMSGPAISDPIWGGSEPYDIKGIDCTSSWVEFIFGVEVKMYRNFHMGWAVRYKREISSTKSLNAKPSCIPGYGYTTNSTCWSASYSLIFDLNWGKKKNTKKGVSISIKDIPTETTDSPTTPDDEEQEEEEIETNEIEEGVETTTEKRGK